MELDILLITNGLTCLIISAVSIITGSKLVLKYFQNKERVLLLVGIAWILMYEGWWAPSISFILLLITNQGLSIELFFLVALSLGPVSITLWMIAFTDLMDKKKLQKPLIIILVIQIIFFEAFFLYYLFTEPSMLLDIVGIIDAKYKLLIFLFYIEVICLLIITSTIFAWKSFKLDNHAIRLKAKFILIGFILFIIGASLDFFLELDILTMLLYRGLLVISSFTFYFGFFLPKSLKNLLLKEN